MDRIILLCHGKIVIFPLKILYYLDKSTTEYHPTACAFVLYTLYKYKRFVTLPVRSAYPLCEEIDPCKHISHLIYEQINTWTGMDKSHGTDYSDTFYVFSNTVIIHDRESTRNALWKMMHTRIINCSPDYAQHFL